MSSLSRWTEEHVAQGGWIRRMFAEGQRLRAEFGDDAVADLSLGQPLEAPTEVHEAMVRAAQEQFRLRHAYMPNLGYADLRERLAAEDVGVDGVTASCIAVTGGAAGAICLALRAFLDPGDEVVGIAPYFPEFPMYCATGELGFVTAGVDAAQRVDIDQLVRALSDRTRAIIVNSPNNPSGHVVDAQEWQSIIDVLDHHNRRSGRRILLIADEAYRNLHWDCERVEPLQLYEQTVLARSFSKDLGLAGERIGYLVLHPTLVDETTERGLETCMRALGMVSAPATAQRTLMQLSTLQIDVSPYRRLRDHTVKAATAAELDFAPPQGGIYLWVRSPFADTLEFVQTLAEQRVLVTPGVAFGVPEYVRACFTASEAAISTAMEIAGTVLAGVRPA